MSERSFHELNQIAQYAEHIRWIVDTYPLPEKVEAKLRLTAQVLDAEAKTFEALEAKLSTMDAKLLHCEAHDETAWEFPHGENLVWAALTDEQKVYWKALAAQKEQSNETA